MNDTPTSLSARLTSEGEKTLEFWRSLTPGHWLQIVYEGQTAWDAHRLLAHFVSAEESFLPLIADILAGGNGAPADFDIDRYNSRQTSALAGMSADELMERFLRARQATSSLVASLSPADLVREGRHPYLGLASLAEIIKLIYRHNQIHQRDMRRLLANADGGV